MKLTKILLEIAYGQMLSEMKEVVKSQFKEMEAFKNEIRTKTHNDYAGNFHPQASQNSTFARSSGGIIDNSIQQVKTEGLSDL